MGSENQGHSFDPLDLEILDRVYEVARAHIVARDLYCKPEDTREAAVRKSVFSHAGGHPVDFDVACDKVVAGLNGRPRS
jgi:hypothetical protein